MADTTQVATEIRHLMTAEASERQLLATVAQHFPDLTSGKLSQPLQVATTAAERQVVRSQRRERLAHWRAIKPKKPQRN